MKAQLSSSPFSLNLLSKWKSWKTRKTTLKSPKLRKLRSYITNVERPWKRYLNRATCNWTWPLELNRQSHLVRLKKLLRQSRIMKDCTGSRYSGRSGESWWLMMKSSAFQRWRLWSKYVALMSTFRLISVSTAKKLWINLYNAPIWVSSMLWSSQISACQSWMALMLQGW